MSRCSRLLKRLLLPWHHLSNHHGPNSRKCSLCPLSFSTQLTKQKTITSTVTVTATASPTNSPCQGHTCSQGITTCNKDETCYCFVGTNSTSICAANVLCEALPACALDSDCASGSVCALETCCPSHLGGVCFSPLCDNPAMRLMHMATIGRADTAAYRLE